MFQVGFRHQTKKRLSKKTKAAVFNTRNKQKPFHTLSVTHTHAHTHQQQPNFLSQGVSACFCKLLWELLLKTHIWYLISSWQKARPSF